MCNPSVQDLVCDWMQMICAARAGTTSYPVGACKMSPASDPYAVVSAMGRAHGIAGLHVVDASIMPTVPRANPNLPTQMAAKRIVAALD